MHSMCTILQQEACKTWDWTARCRNTDTGLRRTSFTSRRNLMQMAAEPIAVSVMLGVSSQIPVSVLELGTEAHQMPTRASEPVPLAGLVAVCGHRRQPQDLRA